MSSESLQEFEFRLPDPGEGLTEAEIVHLNRVWHRLDPWPDAIPSLRRLKPHYVLAPLSNGHVRLLTSMAKRAGILSGHYKTDAGVYLTAAHERDLDASQDVGLHSWELLGEQYLYRRPHRTAPDSRGRGLDIPHSNSRIGAATVD